MNRHNRKRLIKFLFTILSANPFEYGIVPGEGGWVRLKDLHWALRQTGSFPSVSVAGLKQLFELYRPEKFEIKHKHVRVLPEFHSPGLMKFSVAAPPDILYLPVRPRAHAHVLSRGLRPAGDAKWIVLWKEMDMALRAGKRRDREPVIARLKVDSAMRQGAVFHEAGGCIYLAQWLEPQWLDMPALPEMKENIPARGSKDQKNETGSSEKSSRKMPGSFIPEHPPAWYGHGDIKSTGHHGKKRHKRAKPYR